MRSRGSVSGPLLLIVVGSIFLVHEFAPGFSLGDFIGRFWPYFLIAWGFIQLVEVGVRAMGAGPIPTNGVSGWGWFLALLICFAGLGTWEFQRPDMSWWRRVGFEQGVEVLGDQHDYNVDTIRRATAKNPRIVIESFRGNARVVGSDGATVQLSAHKNIRAMEAKEADKANEATPVELIVEGDRVIVRCNQSKADSRARVTTDLELTVPKGASLEATGHAGDFDISSLAGDVDLTSDNAGVRLTDVDGTVKVDTRKSDLIRCNNVKGNVELRGHGTDVELEKIAGEVTVDGEYTGTISLTDVAKPLRVASMQTELNVRRLPGEIKLERGNLMGHDLVGPVQCTTHATDVDLTGFTDSLELSVEKGDIDLKPALPVGRLDVKTHSGNIDLALPEAAKFEVNASTDRGEIENEFGESLRTSTQGHGAKMEGAVGTGPALTLAANRGNITVRKAGTEPSTTGQSDPDKEFKDKKNKKLLNGSEVSL